MGLGVRAWVGGPSGRDEDLVPVGAARSRRREGKALPLPSNSRKAGGVGEEAEVHADGGGGGVQAGIEGCVEDHFL